MNYTSITKVKAIKIHRMSTGQSELDWLYGVSEFPAKNEWGMPVGTISTWVGEGGVGKSRMAISVAKSKVSDGHIVLYFQNEVDLPTLASWVDDPTLDNLYCSDSTDLAEQAKIIKELVPDFVFVDSINLIDGYGNGNDGVVREIAKVYREAIKGTKTHVIFLCQLNKDGSAKGSSSLKHLPDIQMLLTNEPGGCFKVSFGDDKPKHRYGRVSSEYYGIWKHTDDGVECISNNRFKDSRWAKTDSYKTAFDTRKSVGFGSEEVIPGTGYDEIIPGTDGMPPPPFRKVPQVPQAPVPNIKLSDRQLTTPVKKEVTLANCSPAVRKAFYTLHPELKPTLWDRLFGN